MLRSNLHYTFKHLLSGKQLSTLNIQLIFWQDTLFPFSLKVGSEESIQLFEDKTNKMKTLSHNPPIFGKFIAPGKYEKWMSTFLRS